MTFTAGQKLRASQMPQLVCTSGTRPAGHSGQTVYETDTGMVAMFDGTSWSYIAATGGVSTSAEYNMSTSQSIANTTDTIVEFGTTNRTSPLVVRSTAGAGHRFTFQRAGRWAITVCVRFASAAVAGERYTLLTSSDGGLCSQGQVMPATASPLTLNTSSTRYFPVNGWVQAQVYQATGGTRTMEFNNGSGWGRICMTWIGS